MAELDDRNLRNEESAPPESRPLPDESKGAKRKKKKKRGCGFFLLMILLAAGAAAGLQASGGVDLRPYVYPAVPKIPYIGESLKKMLAIPDAYAVTSEERRRVELEEWEGRIAEYVRSIDERESRLNVLSDDLGERERLLDAERDDIENRMASLSRDMDERGTGAEEPDTSSSSESDIEDTIRTFQDMSPKNAAAILEKLDSKLAVAVLDGLPMDARGKLLGRMEADKAAALTEQLTELQKKRARQKQGN